MHKGITLSSESFHGEYTVTGIMEGYKEKEVNGTSILLSKEALKGWSGYDPADYRAYVHFKNEQQMDETELTARSREIAKEYQLEMPVMNLSYMKFYKQPVNVSMLALVAGIAVLVIIGGYVVIQSTGKYHRREDSEDRPRKCPKKKAEPAKKDGEHHAGIQG